MNDISPFNVLLSKKFVKALKKGNYENSKEILYKSIKKLKYDKITSSSNVDKLLKAIKTSDIITVIEISEKLTDIKGKCDLSVALAYAIIDGLESDSFKYPYNDIIKKLIAGGACVQAVMIIAGELKNEKILNSPITNLVHAVYTPLLVKALNNNDLNRIEEILDSPDKPDINCRIEKYLQDKDFIYYGQGTTILMLAARKTNLKIVKKILYMGAVPDVCDCVGRTAVDYAILAGDFETLKYLCDNLNLKPTDFSLNYATEINHFDMMRYLIEQKDVHVDGMAKQNKARKSIMAAYWDSPLIIASSEGRFEQVKYLIEKKANIFETGENNLNAIMAAEMSNHLNIVEYLKSSSSI